MCIFLQLTVKICSWKVVLGKSLKNGCIFLHEPCKSSFTKMIMFDGEQQAYMLISKLYFFPVFF